MLLDCSHAFDVVASRPAPAVEQDMPLLRRCSQLPDSCRPHALPGIHSVCFMSRQLITQLSGKSATLVLSSLLDWEAGVASTFLAPREPAQGAQLHAHTLPFESFTRCAEASHASGFPDSVRTALTDDKERLQRSYDEGAVDFRE